MNRIENDRTLINMANKLKDFKYSPYSIILSLCISILKFVTICVCLIVYSRKKVENTLRFFLFLNFLISCLDAIINFIKLYSFWIIQQSNYLQARFEKLFLYSQVSRIMMTILFSSSFSTSVLGYDVSAEATKLLNFFLVIQYYDFIYFVCTSSVICVFIFAVIFLKKKEESHKYQADVSDFNDECNICIENYKNDDRLLELVCKHKFHYDCINTWINMQNNCPICKRELSADLKVYEEEDLKL